MQSIIRGWLPTEEEWEYACRAGSTTPWSHGDNLESLHEFANIADAIPEEHAPPHRVAQIVGVPRYYLSDGYPLTSPAGLFKHNELGLYEMHEKRDQHRDPAIDVISR